MSDTTDALLGRVISYLDKGEAFLGEQVPDFAKQLMEYHAWGTEWTFNISLIFAIFFFLISMITLIIGVMKESGEVVWIFILTGIVFLVSFVVCVSNYKDLKMYEKAPKVYLVKVVKELASSRSCGN